MRTLIVAFSVALIAGPGFAVRGFAAQQTSTVHKTTVHKTTAHKKSTKSTHKSVRSTKTAATHAPAKTAGRGSSKTAAAATHRSTKTTRKTTVAHRSTRHVTRHVARRVTQQQPTTERYKEIQQALADKGFFSGPVDGTWGPGSVDALKHFQREQNIPDDGKIGSLALIALGLGPRRTMPPQPESPVVVSTPQP